MNKRIEHKEPISLSIVASYFPKNINKLFGLEGLSFFGQLHEGTDEDSCGRGKFSSKYMMLLHNPHITGLDISFLDGSNKWIRGEHSEFESLQKSYPELTDCYPLLVLRLVSEYMRIESPFIYMDFLRYADHEQFRKRGIATAVFDSVSSRLKDDGVKYLYISARFSMPSKSYWLSRDEVPNTVKKEISSLFYDKPQEKVMPWNDSYLRIL